MARMILKERQFEPTGVNLGDFESKDLETFDIQFKDSDKEEVSDNNEESNTPQSHVPDPIDPEPLKKDNKGSSGNAGDSSSSSQENTQQDEDDDTEQGLSEIPDEWDPYGDNPDDKDPDIPDPIQNDSDDEWGGGGSSSGTSGGVDDSQSGDGEENQSGDLSDGDDGDSQDSENSDGSSSSGDSAEDDGENADGSGESSGESSDGSSGEDGQNIDMPGDTDSGDNNSMSNGQSSSSSDRNSSDSQGGEGEDSDDSTPGQDADATNTDQGGTSSSQNTQKDDPNAGLSYDPSATSQQEEDNDDFDPAGDIKSISDLEKALEQMDKNETSTAKEKRKSDEEMTKEDDNQRDNPRNKGQQKMRDREEEAAAAKEILSKAIQDKKERDRQREANGEVDEEDPYVDSSISESEDDILKDLGAGNLTTLFNPSNAHDWRVQLDRLFDRALGFDVVTNPNLVNKKIEDAPPGREDFDPVIKNIVILLDYSGSMGAKEFKQVISHIDTMLKARKLTKTMFHIFPWGSTDAGVLLDRYTKCKGLMFKKTINAKFKSGSGGTYLAPVIPIVMKKVHRPDAIIIMTDAEISDPSAFDSSPMCRSFVKKFRNRIIWALTINANVSNITKFDPTAKAKKRYIKFKKGGSERD